MRRTPDVPQTILVRQVGLRRPPDFTPADGNFWKLTVYRDFDESEPLPMWSHARCIKNAY